MHAWSFFVQKTLRLAFAREWMFTFQQTRMNECSGSAEPGVCTQISLEWAFTFEHSQ